jgi:hypothetical protein
MIAGQLTRQSPASRYPRSKAWALRQMPAPQAHNVPGGAQRRLARHRAQLLAHALARGRERRTHWPRNRLQFEQPWGQIFAYALKRFIGCSSDRAEYTRFVIQKQRARRSIPRTSALPSQQKTIRSITAISKAPPSRPSMATGASRYVPRAGGGAGRSGPANASAQGALELAQYLEKVGPWMIAHFGRLTQFCLRRF